MGERFNVPCSVRGVQAPFIVCSVPRQKPNNSWYGGGSDSHDLTVVGRSSRWHVLLQQTNVVLDIVACTKGFVWICRNMVRNRRVRPPGVDGRTKDSMRERGIGEVFDNVGENVCYCIWFSCLRFEKSTLCSCMCQQHRHID